VVVVSAELQPRQETSVVSPVDADLVGAGVCPVGLVGDSLHRGVGDEIADELEFVGTGLLIVAGDGPDCAAMQFDPVVAFVKLLAIGQITLSVGQLGDGGDSTVDRLVDEFVSDLFDESPTATLEHPVERAVWPVVVVARDVVDESLELALVPDDGAV